MGGESWLGEFEYAVIMIEVDSTTAATHHAHWFNEIVSECCLVYEGALPYLADISRKGKTEEPFQ